MSNRLLRQTKKLKQKILTLAGLVEGNLAKATHSVLHDDVETAREVIASDPTVDAEEVDTEEECLKILALYQPVAKDLRFVVAILKLNNDLERIGDLAVNIAEQAGRLGTHERSLCPDILEKMVPRVQAMVHQAIDSLVELDAEAAREVGAADDAVDDLHRSMFQHVIDGVGKNPADVDDLIHYLSVSRYLERIADHATNIAEDVIYMTSGEIVRHGGTRRE